jgi:hypothetical protein
MAASANPVSMTPSLARSITARARRGRCIGINAPQRRFEVLVAGVNVVVDGITQSVQFGCRGFDRGNWS